MPRERIPAAGSAAEIRLRHIRERKRKQAILRLVTVGCLLVLVGLVLVRH